MRPAGTVTKRQTKSSEKALEDLMKECAKAEKSTGDARRLMTRWGVSPSKKDSIIESLIDMKFIDNRRFAEAYTRDKINLSDWGPQRIAQELSRKEIERDIIDEVVGDLDRDMLRERLLKVLSKRKRTTRYKDNYELKGKLLRYGASLGYDYSMMSDTMDEVINKPKEDKKWSDFFF